MKYFSRLLNPKAETPYGVDNTLSSACSDHNQSHEPELPGLDLTDLNQEITLEEVQMAVGANNNHKSPRFYVIRPSLIKSDASIQFLHSLYNQYFSSETVPKAWLKAIFKPIPKTKQIIEVYHYSHLLQRRTAEF